MPEPKANPRIVEVEVGVRVVKTIRIYPLSVGHQMEVSDTVSSTLSKILEQRLDNIDKEVVAVVVNVVKENLGTILEFVIDPEELKSNGYANVKELLYDVDNEQMWEIAKVIKQQNFERIAKNLKGPLMAYLLTMPEMSSTSRGPSQESATSIQDTDSSISSDSGIGKEE